MTCSSPSPDPITDVGFARHEHEGDRLPLQGPFVSEMRGPLGGVYLQDMPMARPVPKPRPKIKGLPGGNSVAPDDYAPGGGTWSDASGG